MFPDKNEITKYCIYGGFAKKLDNVKNIAYATKKVKNTAYSPQNKSDF